jgi:hypothetical protein
LPRAFTVRQPQPPELEAGGASVLASLLGGVLPLSKVDDASGAPSAAPSWVPVEASSLVVVVEEASDASGDPSAASAEPSAPVDASVPPSETDGTTLVPLTVKVTV